MGPTGTLTFACSICVEPSHDICVYCTKDVCRLHRCQRCLRCSDCCECESPLCLDEEPPIEAPIEALVEPVVEMPIELAGEAVEIETEVPVEESIAPEPVREPSELETTEPDPESPGEHLPGTSTNGVW
jgi:hypothetical protein